MAWTRWPLNHLVPGDSSETKPHILSLRLMCITGMKNVRSVTFAYVSWGHREPCALQVVLLRKFYFFIMILNIPYEGMEDVL